MNEKLESLYMFPVNDWNGSHYASSCNLWDAFRAGKINCEVSETQYGAHYKYSTKEGIAICTYYKDSTFGHSSQAYGNVVPAPYIMFPLVNAELDRRFEERAERIRKFKNSLPVS